MRNKNSKMDYV